MRVGTALQISKREWIALGGLSNPNLFRKGTRSGWSYWMLTR
jgi:hypothetical protein